MSEFAHYTDATFDAYVAAGNKKDIVAKKNELLTEIFKQGPYPSSVLVIGFTPFIFAFPDSVTVTIGDISDKAFAYVTRLKPTVKRVFALAGKYDCVVTGDEYFTFAKSTDEQIQKITDICALAKNTVVTTLKDYKNLDFKEREVSTPAVIKDENTTRFAALFLEHHNSIGRNTWETTVFKIDSELTEYGPFVRTSLFFKQMAKFSADAGAKEFLVHKNLMNKSLIRKNYDHIISIKL